MIRIATCFFLTISNFYCSGQQTANLTYKDKYQIIIGEAKKHPEESEFADKYLNLTEMTIALADSLIAEMMRPYRDTSFLYLANDPKTEKFFSGMKNMYSFALQKIRDVELKQRINERLLEVVAGKNLKNWVSKCFKGISTIESLAALRELQTGCLELTDLVFDQIMQKVKETK